MNGSNRSRYVIGWLRFRNVQWNIQKLVRVHLQPCTHPLERGKIRKSAAFDSREGGGADPDFLCDFPNSTATSSLPQNRSKTEKSHRRPPVSLVSINLTSTTKPEYPVCIACEFKRSRLKMQLANC